MFRDRSYSNIPKLDDKLNVSILGRAQVTLDSGTSIILPRKSFLLFALLVIDGRNGSIKREVAAEFLWEDVDSERRDGNLRNLLYRERLAFGAHGNLSLFDIEEGEIRISSSIGYIDVVAFRAALSRVSKHNILTVCEAYRGELLQGQTANGEKLTHWLRDRRSGLQQELVNSVAHHLDTSSTAALPPQSQVAAKKLLQIDVNNEAAYRVLMRHKAERGDTKAVAALYRKLARLLDREFQAKPEEKTRELYKQLNGVNAAEAAQSATLVDRKPAAAPIVSRYRPRVALVTYRPADSSRLEGDILAGLIDQLVEQLWLSSEFLIQDLGTHGISDTLFRQSVYHADIDYIVEIACRRSEASSIAMSFRLVERATRDVLWTKSYRIHDRIMQAVHDASYCLMYHVEVREIAKLSESAAYTNAYRLAIQGGRALQTLELPSVRRARGIMKSALAADPDHIPALAGLARSYVLEGLLATRADKKLLDEAEHHAKKIISLNPQNSRGYQELGVARLYGRHFASGTDFLRKARELNPGNVDVNIDLADALVSIGASREALSILGELSNTASVNADLRHWIAASAHYSLESYKEALKCIDSMRNPESVSRLSAAAHAMLGERERAAEVREAAMDFNPSFRTMQWLAQSPIGQREAVQHYATGLRSAGFP